MPWIARPRGRKPARAAKLRRWRYDNSQGVVSFWIGAVIVGIAAIAAAMLRFYG
jgi:hypothetical protein